VAKTRILIANRGEIAVRIIRTVRELGLRSVAVYSDADRDALHVEMADESYYIGPALSADSYLSIGAVLEAARRARATAIHPGYGFLSERAHFARAVIESGYVFIGPSPEAIETMGDKAAARQAAERAGVPIVPGTIDPVTVDDAPAEAERIGYPVMVKAAFGGGGRGMLVVRKPEDLSSALARATREATSYFGRPEVFLERYIEHGHHVEAQVLADTHGTIAFLGERDCSVQRRHQKLIEETPSPVVDADLRTRLGEAAIALARACGYVNAGTVECIVDEDGSFYFLEMNTRLQVEHPVTEFVTGLDLVELMLLVAAGERLPLAQKDVRLDGWAVEARIYADDPFRKFLPSTGRLVRYIPPPAEPGVRVDTGVYEGGEVSMYYDPMIAKLIVHDQTREAALLRLRTAGPFGSGACSTTSASRGAVQHPRARRAGSRRASAESTRPVSTRNAPREPRADGGRRRVAAPAPHRPRGDRRRAAAGARAGRPGRVDDPDRRRDGAGARRRGPRGP
jgi:acetyl/propionyl-CoA carboxylase alpha subunit